MQRLHQARDCYVVQQVCPTCGTAGVHHMIVQLLFEAIQ